MDWTRTIRIRVEVPFIEIGGVYELNDETGEVFRMVGTEKIGPLRPSLAQYIYLLATEREYVEFISSDPIP